MIGLRRVTSRCVSRCCQVTALFSALTT